MDSGFESGDPWPLGTKRNTLSKMIREVGPRFTTVALFFPASKKGISKFRSHTFRVAVCTLTIM
jgi:hypothetical protein